MMNEVVEIVTIIRARGTDNLFISLLIIKLLSYFYCKEVYTVSKEIIRWLIIGYACLSILSWVTAIAVDDTPFLARATGPYAATFWLLVFFSCVLPFTLILHKIKHKGWAIFIVAFLINTGWLFERYVIIVTSLHRDYLPSSWSTRGTFGPFMPLVTILIRGTLIAIFITGISILVTKYRKTTNNDIKPLR